MWARGAVVVDCVLGYVMLIGGGGGAAAGFSPLGVSLFWDGGLGGLSSSGCLAGGDWYFLVLFSGCLGLWREGGLWAVSKIESSARLHCLPRFILLVISSDTLLVVSILDIV